MYWMLREGVMQVWWVDSKISAGGTWLENGDEVWYKRKV